jgi:hypothetical protein
LATRNAHAWRIYIMSVPNAPQPNNIPAVDQTLILPDGRALGYAIWGEPEGAPVLLLGTSLGSRLLCPDLPATLAAQVHAREGDHLLAIPMWAEVLGSLGLAPGH